MRAVKHIWARRVKFAKEKSVFCESDRDMAKHWPTCAVGEEMARLASQENLKAFLYNRECFFARYKALSALGFEFHHLVNADKPHVAETTLARIERYIARYLSGKKRVSL